MSVVRGMRSSSRTSTTTRHPSRVGFRAETDSQRCPVSSARCVLALTTATEPEMRRRGLASRSRSPLSPPLRSPCRPCRSVRPLAPSASCRRPTSCSRLLGPFILTLASSGRRKERLPVRLFRVLGGPLVIRPCVQQPLQQRLLLTVEGLVVDLAGQHRLLELRHLRSDGGLVVVAPPRLVQHGA